MSYSLIPSLPLISQPQHLEQYLTHSKGSVKMFFFHYPAPDICFH